MIHYHPPSDRDCFFCSLLLPRQPVASCCRYSQPYIVLIYLNCNPWTCSDWKKARDSGLYRHQPPPPPPPLIPPAASISAPVAAAGADALPGGRKRQKVAAVGAAAPMAGRMAAVAPEVPPPPVVAYGDGKRGGKQKSKRGGRWVSEYKSDVLCWCSSLHRSSPCYYLAKSPPAPTSASLLSQLPCGMLFI